MKKIGHAGTLDPFATGLLVVCAGRPATRLISRIMDGVKEYHATLCLGMETTTSDPEGEITRRCAVDLITHDGVEAVLTRFQGEQLQTPPAYSALKHKGKPLYYYARKGIAVEKPPRKITISTLERSDGDGDIAGGETAELKLRVVCSKGTYIRTLAEDIGRELGCGAYLTGLRRTRSGCFNLENALTWEELATEDARSNCLGKVINLSEVCKLLQ
jgi:tRNA pseudouridine55 synthase